MSTVKNRGADVAPKAAEQAVSIERLANIGETVTTSKGSLTIKEPTLEQVIELLVHIVPLSSALTNEKNKAGKDFVVDLAMKPEFKEALRKVAASLANVEEDYFVDLGITDWLKVLVAVKKVVNWEELRELFSQLNLTDLLSQVQ